MIVHSYRGHSPSAEMLAEYGSSAMPDGMELVVIIGLAPQDRLANRRTAAVRRLRMSEGLPKTAKFHR